METFDSNAIHMELKYCERCGGLWLRLQGSELVFCPACATILAGIARDPRFLEHGRARSNNSAYQHEAEKNAWSEGGNA
jgi:Zn-finger nucleic acid-binding protein